MMCSTGEQPCPWQRQHFEYNGITKTSVVSRGNDVTVDRRHEMRCHRSHRIFSGVVFRVAMLVVCTLYPQHQSNAQPTIRDFNYNDRRLFRDPNNTPGYYSNLYVDPQNANRLYVAALDFVYRLDTSDIRYKYLVSDNLTAATNYTVTYGNSVRTCQSMGNVRNKAYGCRNYARAVFPVSSTNEIYVCSTGAFNPQEYYLNSDLRVVSVERRASSGSQRCPYDPAAIYAPLLVESGNPYNFSSLYTGVAINSFTGYITLYRSPLYSDRFYSSAPARTLSTIAETIYSWINTASDVFVVNVFDIDKYVYYFFREVAVESTWLCSPTYYSRVARICKNDLGVDNLGLTSRFTSYFKARLVCRSVGLTPDSPYYFNQVQDVKYNATSGQFYALFTANNNPQWGSAVCQYSLTDIDKVFNSSPWVERPTTTSAWVQTDARFVPSPRPGQCIGSSLNYDTSTASFILSHPLMRDLVNPVTITEPTYFSRQLSFSKLEVNIVGNSTIFYLYLPDLGEIHRISVYADAVNVNQLHINLLSIWQPFYDVSSSLPLPVVNMLLSSNNQKSWLYLTVDFAVVQLSVEQCRSYSYCKDCVRDPYCGWNLASASCMPYQPGLLQAAYSSEPLEVCQPNCVASYRRPDVIPGMSILLNCSSKCEPPEADVTWYYLVNRTEEAEQVPLDTDSNYVLTRDNGLVILMVNRTQHVGIFQCVTSSGVLLAEHLVTTSVCEYGDNVRDVWLKEYINFCAAFDDYRTEYNKWRCMQAYCVQHNCTQNAAQCNKT